ncbi:MAG: RCC1 domain-containing protein [Verrucomicrobiae bacterium]|nr:RCC1 domain-containing protein [Verrucomicrobiae bacterium]
MPGDLTNVIAIAAGWEHALALRDDHTVVGWGNGTAKDVPAGLSNVVAVSAG